MHERAAALGRAYGLPADVPFHYVSMPTPWLNASNEAGMTPLHRAIERYQPKIIALDNLLLIKGNVDENSGDMGTVMAHLRQAVEQYDSAIIPIHHQRKDHGNGGRAGDRLRGHSSIEAAVDLALLVERQEGSSELTVRSTKTRGADVLTFGAMFTFEHKPGTSELYEARFYGRMIEDQHSDRAIESAIRDLLKDHSELMKMELCTLVHELLRDVGLNRIRGVIERMANKKQIRRRPGPKGGEYFSLASRR